MACNCKRKIELEEKYGTKEELSLYDKIVGGLFKFVLMVLIAVIGIIICPILFVLSLYKVFFGNKMIVLPKFLSKYMMA